MWDRAGKITVSLRKELPDFEVGEANPAKVELNNTKSSATIAFTPNSLVASSVFNPKVKGGFADESTQVANIVLDQLEVRVLNRIGNRIKFTQRRDSEEAAVLSIKNFAQKKGITVEAFSEQDDSILKKSPTEFLARFKHEGSGITVHLKSSVIRPQIAASYKRALPGISKVTDLHGRSRF